MADRHDVPKNLQGRLEPNPSEVQREERQYEKAEEDERRSPVRWRLRLERRQSRMPQRCFWSRQIARIHLTCIEPDIPAKAKVWRAIG